MYSFGAVNGPIRLLLIIWAYTKASRTDIRMANWDNTASPIWSLGAPVSGVTDNGPNKLALTIPDNGKGALLDLK